MLLGQLSQQNLSELGVLKVNVGDAVTPDWRNIGCGGSGGGDPGRLKLWDGTRWVREKCAGDSATGPNLIPNGDFETDVSGWEADDQIGGPSTFARSTAWASTGVGSFESTGYGGNGAWYRMSAYANVTAGAAYLLSGQLKRIGGTSIDGFHYGAYWYDSSHTFLVGTDAGPTGTLTDGAIGGTVTAPSGASYARVYFQARGTAAHFYVDSLSMALAAMPARPLKMWDGTAWQTVACMVPV